MSPVFNRIQHAKLVFSALNLYVILILLFGKSLHNHNYSFKKITNSSASS